MRFNERVAECPPDMMFAFGATSSRLTANVGGVETTTSPTPGDPSSSQPGVDVNTGAVTQIPMTQMGMTAIKEELATAMIIKAQIPTGIIWISLCSHIALEEDNCQLGVFQAELELRTWSKW